MDVTPGHDERKRALAIKLERVLLRISRIEALAGTPLGFVAGRQLPHLRAQVRQLRSEINGRTTEPSP